MIRPRHALIPEAYEQRPYFKRLVKGAIQESKIALRTHHSEPPSKFVIFAQGRTGSTLLTSTLDTHPKVRCEDEILIVPRVRPMSFVENCARIADVSAFGFHVKITQLLAWQRVKAVDRFLASMENAGWKIIYLRRDNVLRHVISNIFAEAIGEYRLVDGQENKSPEQIALPLDRLEYEMRLRTELGQAERKALKARNYFELVYERDLLDRDRQIETFGKLQSMIGVPHVELTPRLKKMVVKPLEELISNYDEVDAWMRQRPDYLRFLDG